jgi:hypothetical protein
MIGRLRGAASRRPVLAALGLGAVALLVAAPVAHADVWANVGPGSSLAGLKGGPALGHYDLDQQFSAISAGVFSGIDASGLLPMVAYFFAKEVWLFTAWMANLLIELFGFAFSLDLVNGSAATHGAGALGPVSRAISSIYSSVFGGPWMVLAFSFAGIWAMWKALVQRRYAETAGQLALSLLYIGIAFLFVLQPAQTIGTASHWTNEMSGAFLSIAKDGEPASQGEAKEAGADQLFGLLVAQPWAILEFGGLDHCVKAAAGSEEPESVAVEPLPEGSARRLESGEQVSAGGKTCINNLKKYGPHLLRFEPGSKERALEIEALTAGDSSKLPDADPGKEDGSYKLGAIDKPAGAAMEKEGQYQRLLIAVVVFVAELGAFFLLGALSVGVVTAQILLLLLLAFSPVALVAAAIPGHGHQFFKAWLSKLAGYLLRKAAYSLILAILLTVCAAISAATSELGWLMSFGLQCAFFWAVFLQRRSLTQGLVGVVTGPGSPARDRALDLLALYSGAHLVGGATRPVRRVAKGAGRSALSLGGRFLGRGRTGPLGPRRVPFGGTRQSLDLRGRRGGDDPDEPRETGGEPTKPEGPGGKGGTGGRRDEGQDGATDGGGKGEGQGSRPARPERRRRSSGKSGDPQRRGAAGGDEALANSAAGGSSSSVARRPGDDKQGSANSPRRGGAGLDAPSQEDRRGGLADELRADGERARRSRPADEGKAEPRGSSRGRRREQPDRGDEQPRREDSGGDETEDGR